MSNGSVGKQQRTVPLVEAMDVLNDARAEAVVITAMGAAREWPKLSDHPTPRR